MIGSSLCCTDFINTTIAISVGISRSYNSVLCNRSNMTAPLQRMIGISISNWEIKGRAELYVRPVAWVIFAPRLWTSVMIS